MIKIKLVMPKVEKDNEIKQLAVVVIMAKTPGEQQVDYQWGCGLECYLASSSQLVVAMVDVRGSGGQGTRWQQSVSGRLGVRETKDMEQVVRFLTGLNYIDKNKIGVFGQGYGGFLAINTMLSNHPVLSSIKCGIAVAPVTNWMFTTAFETERLLGMPGMKDSLLN